MIFYNTQSAHTVDSSEIYSVMFSVYSPDIKFRTEHHSWIINLKDSLHVVVGKISQKLYTSPAPCHQGEGGTDSERSPRQGIQASDSLITTTFSLFQTFHGCCSGSDDDWSTLGRPDDWSPQHQGRGQPKTNPNQMFMGESEGIKLKRVHHDLSMDDPQGVTDDDDTGTTFISFPIITLSPLMNFWKKFTAFFRFSRLLNSDPPRLFWTQG